MPIGFQVHHEDQIVSCQKLYSKLLSPMAFLGLNWAPNYGTISPASQESKKSMSVHLSPVENHPKSPPTTDVIQKSPFHLLCL